MATVYTSNKYLPFSRIDRIYVTLLAPSGAGKTTFVCALHHQISDRLNNNDSGIRYVPDGKKSLKKMELVTYDKNRKEQVDLIEFTNDNISDGETTESYMMFKRGVRPNPYTTYVRNLGEGRAAGKRLKDIHTTDDPCLLTYHFFVNNEARQIQDDDKVELSFLDYPGGRMGLGETKAALLTRVKQSLALIVPVDAVAVVEFARIKRELKEFEKALPQMELSKNDRYSELKECAECLSGILNIYDVVEVIKDWMANCNASESDGVLFFTPVKCESFLVNETLCAELKHAVKEAFFDISGGDGRNDSTVGDKFATYNTAYPEKAIKFRKTVRERIDVFYAPVQTYGRIFLTREDTSEFWRKNKDGTLFMDEDGIPLFEPEFKIEWEKKGGVSGLIEIFKQIVIKRSDALERAIDKAKGLLFFLTFWGKHKDFIDRHIKISNDLKAFINTMKTPQLERFNWPTEDELNPKDKA